jgi:hypothetical protein
VIEHAIPCGHVDIHDGEGFDRAADAAASFLLEHL